MQRPNLPTRLMAARSRTALYSRTGFVALFTLVLLAGGGPTGGNAPGSSPTLAPHASYPLVAGQIRTHNVGLLVLRVTNSGLFGGAGSTEFNAKWQGGEYLSHAGLWIGAYPSGEQSPHVSTASFNEFAPEMDVRWTIYESFEGIKGGNRIGPQGASFADDDADGLIDEDFDNGFDDDGDGRVDEDYAAIGQQMYSTMYKDDSLLALGAPDHTPLHLLVRQRSLQWSVGDPSESVGLDFEVINTGDQVLRDLYLGFFVDSDVGPKTPPGYWEDDLVGWDHIDTTVVVSEPGACSDLDVQVDTAFMWDATGDVPGVFGSLFLGHSTDDTGIRAPQNVGLTTVAWYTATEEPQNDDERYDLLSRGTKPVRNATQPDDYRFVVSAGPFDRLNPGESLSLQTALVVGDGHSGFRANAVTAHQVFRGFYVDADGNPGTGVDGKERCLQILEQGQVIEWDDPCDTLQVVYQFRQTDPCNVAGPHWVDSDCDPCTGVNGQETLVNWVSLTAPPSPNTNLDPNLFIPGLEHYTPPAGNRRVFLQWDNRTELWTQPITGLGIFEGYRIYRIENWTEPFVPTSEDFMLIAQFESTQGTLREVTNREVEPVGQTDDDPPKPIYPIGRYEFVDEFVQNDVVYYYAVTGFGFTEVWNPNTGQTETIELEGLPMTSLAEAVVPCDSCEIVVPVTLLSFTAERVGPRVDLRWAVSDVRDHAGFHVHRSEPEKERIRLTPTLLTDPSRYEFVDIDAPRGAAEYWLEERSRAGVSSWHGPVPVAPAASFLVRLTVGRATPNPFRTQMSLQYTLPESRPVRISVFDLHGRKVRELVNAAQGPGSFSVEWRGEADTGTRVAPGLYLIRFQAGSETHSRKALFLR